MVILNKTDPKGRRSWKVASSDDSVATYHIGESDGLVQAAIRGERRILERAIEQRPALQSVSVLSIARASQRGRDMLNVWSKTDLLERDLSILDGS